MDGSLFAPLLSSGDLIDPVWSPDGRRLAFLKCSHDDSYDNRGSCTLYAWDKNDGVSAMPGSARIIDLIAWTR